MIAKWNVKLNGKWYKAGDEIPEPVASEPVKAVEPEPEVPEPVTTAAEVPEPEQPKTTTARKRSTAKPAK